MNRRLLTFIILAVVVLVAGATTVYLLLPKKYKVARHLTQTVAFWNDKEAFLFLSGNNMGRASNTVQDRFGTSNYGLLLLLLDPPQSFYQQDLTVYHLLASGELEQPALPDHVAAYGSWALHDGRLQLNPVNIPYQNQNGFRWDGSQFVSVPPEEKSAARSVTLSPDDSTDDDEDDNVLSKTERSKFKEAGWHYKLLSGYGGGSEESTLPLDLGGNTFNLILQSFPYNAKAPARFDLTNIGTRSLELSGDKLNPSPAVLWNQDGWKEISRAEYLARFQKFGHPAGRPVRLFVWLLVLLLLLVWKFAAWAHVLFAFGGIKKKVLKNLPSSYSFPAATPTQFPLLDVPELERYSRELESMGFTRLMDFSLTGDRSRQAANFCRLMAHSRYHCFAEITQLFPNGRKPMPAKLSFLSILQDGWTMNFSDRKPLAASSLIRRRKAIAVSMPELGSRELFQSFLKMRDQVSMDLGISPLTDDSLDAYIRQVQRALGEMREAVQQKSFAVAVPQVYLRKLALAKTRPEYAWLGDYPKEAEHRKQGFAVPAGAH